MREFLPIDDDFLPKEIPIILTIKYIRDGAWDMLVSMTVKQLLNLSCVLEEALKAWNYQEITEESMRSSI
jgi:hypothetical protein